MITSYVTLQLPSLPARPLGTFTGRSARDIIRQVQEKWPLLPPSCLYIDGRPIPPVKLPGFRDPETKAKAVAKLRDPEVQRRKVATRLATEAARRAREAAMTPEERQEIFLARRKKYDGRWRRYWQGKAAQREQARRDDSR